MTNKNWKKILKKKMFSGSFFYICMPFRFIQNIDIVVEVIDKNF